MSVPKLAREEISTLLWSEADRVGWSTMTDHERAKIYERWTKDAALGVRLGHYMDPRQVRVYIKDTLLKAYERDRLRSLDIDVWRALGLAGAPTGRVFIKPHGRILADGRVISWGKSRDWKLILCSVHERAWRAKGTPHAAVLTETGATANAMERKLVASLSDKLGLARLEWLE